MKKRKRNRKFGFDYSSNNVYFVTICTHEKIKHFGSVKNDEMMLNEFGHIVDERIEWLEKKYPYFELHNHIVMPNHVHVLFEINSVKAGDKKVKSVSSLIGAMKTTSSKYIHLAGNEEFRWQRSFHDHIVRSQKRYDLICNYITDNPKRWKSDVHNPESDKNTEEIM